ncbi:MAG: hypothetical protein HQM08_30935 [Candidatus Riflebacteria bacterium]|nr:hypothetical protein [Candidatus Riflebacteria bacterium]
MFFRKPSDHALKHAQDKAREDADKRILQARIDAVFQTEGARADRAIARIGAPTGGRGVPSLRPTGGQALALDGSAPLELYRKELARLETELADTVAKTETIARIKYTKWRLDKEKEKLYLLQHGVTFPRTGYQDQLDEFFGGMERRLEEQRRDFEYRSREIEHHEQARIEDQREHEIALLEARGATNRQAEQAAIRAAERDRLALEQARIAAGREAAELLAKALADDLK